MNDRLDVALATGADGVHLRGDSISVAEARRLAPPPFLIGRSVHSARGSRRGGRRRLLDRRDGLDERVKACGPSPSWRRTAFARSSRAARVPVLAIGGVTVSRAHSVAALGGAGIAAIGLFMDASPAQSVEPNRCATSLLRARGLTPPDRRLTLHCERSVMAADRKAENVGDAALREARENAASPFARSPTSRRFPSARSKRSNGTISPICRAAFSAGRSSARTPSQVGLDPESGSRGLRASQFPHDSVTAGHPASSGGDDVDSVESDKRMATVVHSAGGGQHPADRASGVFRHVQRTSGRGAIRHGEGY